MPLFSLNEQADKISYRVVRSRRRTLAIEVRAQGEVVVRAPFAVSDAEITAFMKAKQGWVLNHVRRMAERPQRREWSKEETKRLVDRARAVLPVLVERHAKLMGLSPSGITVTGARTRYGSCSAKGNLCFSCYLMASPDDAIEYVVVHELCHLTHMNHGPRFYALLERYLPDWKDRKKRLTPI